MKELSLPKSYAILEQEEMMYLDGGLRVMTVGAAGSIFNIAIGLIVGGGAGAIATYLKKKGAKEAGRIFTKTIVTRMTAVGLKTLGSTIGGIVAVVLEFTDIGTNIARRLDRIDKNKNNGWLDI